jgi:hypothetical protein
MEEPQRNGIDNRDRTFDGDSNVSDRNLLQSSKVNWEIVSTEFGIQIVSIEHLANAIFSISVSFYPDSNVTVVSDLQSKKQLSQIISTADGIQIDFSDEQPKNAIWSSREIFETDSNVKFSAP